MEWLVEVEEGSYFGPFNAEGVRSLFRDKQIQRETAVYNNRTETSATAADVIDDGTK